MVTSGWNTSLTSCPVASLGFLLVVNTLVFILGMFIDFFEIAFIVVPMLVPVATKLDINLIWFGIILAMNLQTSFLTPPFGFALFTCAVWLPAVTTTTWSRVSASRP